MNIVQNQDFVHLHVHSEFSFPDGACRIQQLIQQVKASGQNAVAVTDQSHLYSAVLFYQEALKAGIHPIIGCELQCADQNQIVLLCQNQQGYQNLIKLVSSENPVSFRLLQQYHTGLICLAVFNSKTLTEGNFSAVQQNIIQYQNLFGSENYFLEIQNHLLPEDQQLLNFIAQLSKNTGIPLVAGNCVNYPKKSDAQMQKILTCIRNNQSLNDFPRSGSEFYLKSAQEMSALFSGFPEAIRNTVRIAQRCHLEFHFHEQKLPHFVQDGVSDNQTYFEQLCVQGLYRHYGANPSQKVRDRLHHEIKIIESMGFTDYFLIVQDFIRYARQQEIPVGPGRGSAAGSLCAYCLDITEIDPIVEDLLFERFLNPGRQSMPDIDIDFCMEGRSQVKNYVTRRYGKNHVAEIVAFDTLKARAAVRDAGRILQFPSPLIDSALRHIDSRLSISASIEQSSELKSLYQQNSQIYDLLNIASQIEGCPRHTTIHAAGIVITDKPVTDYIPVFHNGETLVTEFTMTTLEELGLLKMDFLGLRNLTIIRDAEKSVRMQIPGFSVGNIPFDDHAVYDLISQGNTSGVFQLESDGMRKFLIRLKPQSMQDIMTALAIYRPGPMDSIPDYLRNRQHPEQISYLHPILEEILKPTYGCILYQEQVMQICQKMAGYSYPDADNVRRAMSKKKSDVMHKERVKFIQGALKNSIPEQIAVQVFAQMEKFAEYAFNKSHAAAYARIAYQTAYLKTHHIGEYMAALLTSVISENDKLLPYLDEARNAGLIVCPPDVNSSEWNFVFKHHQLYFGLLAIKGLGRGLIDKILSERRKNGRFISFSDFCKRCVPLGVYQKLLKTLIQSGSLDHLDCNRKQMLSRYEQIFHSVNDQPVIDGQMSLFGETESDQNALYPAMPDFTALEKLQMEKQIFGLYLSGHPLDSLKWLKLLLHCHEIHTLDSLSEHAPVKLLCMIQSCKIIRTKSNAEMCFLRLEDTSGITEAVVFPDLYQTVRNQLQNENILFLTGKVSRKNQKSGLLCDTLHEQKFFPAMLDHMLLCLKVTHSPADLQRLKQLSAFCQRFPGKSELLLYYTDTRNYAYPKQKLSLELSESSYHAFSQLFPAENFGCIPGIPKLSS